MVVHTCEVQMGVSELSQAPTTLTIREVIPLSFRSSLLRMCLKKKKKSSGRPRTVILGKSLPFLDLRFLIHKVGRQGQTGSWVPSASRSHLTAAPQPWAGRLEESFCLRAGSLSPLLCLRAENFSLPQNTKKEDCKIKMSKYLIKCLHNVTLCKCH